MADLNFGNVESSVATPLSVAESEIARLKSEIEQLRLRVSDAEQQAANAITWQAAMVRAENEAKRLRVALSDVCKMLYVEGKFCPDYCGDCGLDRGKGHRGLCVVGVAEAALEAKDA